VTAEQTQITRPIPRPSPISAPYWEAAGRHEITIQRCASCKRHVFYPRLNCPHCGSRDLAWVKASGRGTVYTYTVARRPTHPAFAGQTPYVIAIVELEEGPRMTTNIVGCDPDSVRIGMPVEAAFEDVGPDATLVVFRPAAG
jgi:uncharacterized OB-fold protein